MHLALLESYACKFKELFYAYIPLAHVLTQIAFKNIF